MGKPLLTDEIIEQAKRGVFFQTEESYDAIDLEDLDLAEDWLGEEESNPRIYKSRRIENTKRHAVKNKLNLILVILLLVLGIVIYAVFNW